MTLIRKLEFTNRYLNIPIKAGAPRRTMVIEVAGKVVRAFDVELAETAADFWAFIDVSAWQGQIGTIKLHTLPTVRDETIRSHSADHPVKEDALAQLELSAEIKGSHDLYHESLRPQFHFTVKRGWHNDPNGMVYHEGEYHLFYQYQPFSVSSFSDKSWGHAVSRDLVHWEERPIALWADQEGQKWSGSGVVDMRNVSGLQSGEKPPLLLFYTATGDSAQRASAEPGTGFVQSIAYSNDRGTTWETYAGNPIIPNITPGNRDPLVFWHEPTQRWVMTLFVGQPESWLRDGNQVAAQIFTSADLQGWRYESTVDGFFDCPGLFSLPLDGDAGDLRWVMHCADMKYKVGRFDGRVFTPESDFIVGQYGDCAYAPQLFNHAPDNRRIQIAWGRTQAPGMPFSQIMCFPCDLTMISTAEGPRLCWQPVSEIETLWSESTVIAARRIESTQGVVELAGGKHFDVEMTIDVGNAEAVELMLQGVSLRCDPMEKTLTANGYEAALSLADGKLKLRCLVDRISIEVFAEGGLVYMPLAVIPSGDETGISIRAVEGTVTVDHLECHELNSIWHDPSPDDQGDDSQYPVSP